MLENSSTDSKDTKSGTDLNLRQKPIFLFVYVLFSITSKHISFLLAVYLNDIIKFHPILLFFTCKGYE